MSSVEDLPAISAVADLIQHLTQLPGEWSLPHGGLPWSRGQANSDWPLQPSLLREQYNEQDLTHNFKKRSRGMFNEPPLHALDEWLFVMRHADLPTRLLDWTENALCALYFASQSSPDTNGAVWVLNPYELNKRAFGRPMFVNFEDTQLQMRCRMAFDWFNLSEVKEYVMPIAIAPSHVHPRIRSQRGCFTIHGVSTDNLDSQLGVTPESRDHVLRKYIVPMNAKSAILNQLRLCGITHSALFSDLDGLAQELKATYRA